MEIATTVIGSGAMDKLNLHEITDSQVFQNYNYLLSELKNYSKVISLPTSGESSLNTILIFAPFTLIIPA